MPSIMTYRCFTHESMSASPCEPLHCTILRKLFSWTTEATLVGKLINIYRRSS